MKKQPRIALIAIACVTALGIAGFLGCQVIIQSQSNDAESSETAQEQTDLSSIKEVASLTTVEALYHNVAKFSYDADEGPTGLFKHGHKKAWCEYDARVCFSLDVNKVSTVREGNTITVKMPQANLTGDPKITKMGTPIVETGFLTEFTSEDEQKMISIAQDDLRNKATNDETLINQATENAKKILQQWVQSTGKSQGEDLTVNFVIVD